MTDYMKEFIEDNIELIEAGKLDKVRTRCALNYRSELTDILKSIEAENKEEDTYRKFTSNSDLKIFGNAIRMALRELDLQWRESYVTNGKRILTYKFIGIYGPINREYQIERDICNKLDELNFKYDLVKYNPSEYVTVNMRSFHASTLRIRIVK